MASFDAARLSALMSDLVRPLLGLPTELLPFDSVRAGLERTSYLDLGVREVALDRIVGSLDRASDFNRAFLPRGESLRARWEDVRRLAEGPRGFPPVDLYQVGEVYFVVDGHHRISVARSLGAPAIEARVRQFPSPLEIPGDADLADVERLVREQARRDFLAATGLAAGGADDFGASEPGAYLRLLDHIEKHRYFRGLDVQHPVSWSEAVASWHATLYRPMVRAIRASGILEAFPGRTETDLYLFTMDHLHDLRGRYGSGVPLERGVEAAGERAPRRRRRRRAPTGGAQGAPDDGRGAG